ncbi:hypothetical protein [Holdemanella biformis]
MSKNRKENNTRWSLVVYDVIVYAISSLLLIWLYGGNESLANTESLKLTVLAFAIIFVCRLIGNIYGQIWRYGGIQGYIRMIVSDGIAFILLYVVQMAMPIQRMSFARTLSLVCVNLLGAITIRMIYRYCYLYSDNVTKKGKFLVY